MMTASSAMALEHVKTADYVLPISYEIYDIKGTCSTDFEIPEELVNAIRNSCERYRGYTPRNIKSYTGETFSNNWQMKPAAYYLLSLNGLYGGAMLPVMEAPAVSSDRDNHDFYVAFCTLSDDVAPGELLDGTAFAIDSRDMKALDYGFGTTSIFIDENFNYIDAVPENRKFYVAFSSEANTLNAGLISTIRGKYVEEENPQDRLEPETAQNIADFYGIPVENLKYLSRSFLYSPFEPTEAMKEYVKKDNHEIFANLPTLSVDTEGYYVFPITLPDDAWEEVQSKDISSYKFYALNDDGVKVEDMNLKPLEEEVNPAFVNGLLNTFELFTFSGEKMTKFGVKEFLMIGFLDAGKPFSFYLGKLLLALLMGGCNSGFSSSVILFMILAAAVFVCTRKN